jgi:hypothetical protein
MSATLTTLVSSAAPTQRTSLPASSPRTTERPSHRLNNALTAQRGVPETAATPKEIGA